MADLIDLVAKAYFAPIHDDCCLHARCRSRDVILALLNEIIPYEVEPAWWTDRWDKERWQTRQAIRIEVINHLKAANVLSDSFPTQ